MRRRKTRLVIVIHMAMALLKIKRKLQNGIKKRLNEDMQMHNIILAYVFYMEKAFLKIKQKRYNGFEKRRNKEIQGRKMILAYVI